ncbi:MAG: NUDIX hydrolase [Leptospirillia bacterium]
MSAGNGIREESARSIYQGRIVHLFEKTVRLPGGHVANLEIVHHPGAAAVVPLHADGSVTLVHQYRHAVRGHLYELPAGLLEEGESGIACAVRELKEETGITADTVTPLTVYCTTPGFSDELVHLYLATGLTVGEQELEDDEILSVVRMPLDEALARVEAGDITDGKTVIGLLMAERVGAGA